MLTPTSAVILLPQRVRSHYPWLWTLVFHLVLDFILCIYVCAFVFLIFYNSPLRHLIELIVLLLIANSPFGGGGGGEYIFSKLVFDQKHFFFLSQLYE